VSESKPFASKALPSPTARVDPSSPRRSGPLVLRWVALGLFAAAAGVPLFGNDFYTRMAIEALLLGLLAVSVDVLLGFAGLLSLGQAAYFGLGAYTAALVYLHVAPSLWIVALCVLGVTTVTALVIGLATTRSTGVYFALVTLGVGEILGKINSNISSLGGSDGILGIPIPVVGFLGLTLDLRNNVTFLYLVLAIVSGLCLAVKRLLDTPFGSVLYAIHDNSDRVPYLGYDPAMYKLIAFVGAANLAAIGGMFYPFLRGFVSPVLFGFEYSTRAVVMALLGGLGTLAGPLGGAALVTLLEIAISGFLKHHLLAIGIVFVVCVIFFPSGLVGMLRERVQAAQRSTGA
jgi:branched-chain amino acid transport system permease protein